jgi:chemotaxis signal transduction protein
MMILEQQAGLRPNAWLLDFGKGFRAAVGTRVLLQIIHDPTRYPVPHTPRHCNSVISWQGRLLPVIDMASCLGVKPETSTLMGIVGYKVKHGQQMHLGAIQLSSVPNAIVVRDDQSCSLPEPQPGWDNLAIGCFAHQGEAVPILHMERIFSSCTQYEC